MFVILLSRWLIRLPFGHHVTDNCGQLESGIDPPGACPNYGIDDVLFSPDGRLLATAGVPGTGLKYRIKIWDWQRGKVVHTIRTVAQSVVFDPSGTRLVSTHPVGRAEVWDVGSWKLVTTFTGHPGRVLEATFSPDGALVATAGSDGAVRLWDPESGVEHLTLTGRSVLDTVAFSPDGRKWRWVVRTASPACGHSPSTISSR